MSMRFSKATPEQLDALCALYRDVIADMVSRGLTQWDFAIYPTPELLQTDAERGQLYLVEEDDTLCAAFALLGEQEPEYAQIAWQYGVKPATLHRLAMLPQCFGAEFAGRVLAFAKKEALRLGYDSLRLDASSKDERMLRMFGAHMLRQAGRVVVEDPDVHYACFETPLSDHCPMLPIRMLPAYRHGDMTPWGGDGLRTLYGRDIPDERTGEALEVSAIPGLESRTAVGETLSDLLRRDGARLVGAHADEPFPLLLKLLCAKTPLSVQVHPNDAYAREHEHKLGKTEAWVILKADADASILYGLREGVTLSQLESALEGGGDVEALIDRVPARPGDVFYMPSGMVHAIGGGIVLYEIQQSSDVTYRLWDYDRTDANGNKRPLHIRQSLDVIDPELRGQRAHLPQPNEPGVARLLDVPAFTLDCLTVNGDLELPATPGALRILTALAGLLLSWDGDVMELKAGDTVLLPAACPDVCLTGVGQALVSGAGRGC